MSRAELQKRLLDVGDQMSNMCFNLSQSDKVEPRNRQMMRELCSNWDYFRRAIKAADRERKRPKLTPATTRESKGRKAK